MKPRISKVSVTATGSRPAAWTFTGKVVKGDEIRYEVRDHNYYRGNKWEFLIRVPKEKSKYIEVRPIKVPNIKVLAQLPKLAIAFRRATLRPNVGRYYCKVTVADLTGGARKAILSLKGWRALPWASELKGHLRKKAEVRVGKGTDRNSLVLLTERGDHEMMIKVFFVLKVWVLREGFNPYSLKIMDASEVRDVVNRR